MFEESGDYHDLTDCEEPELCFDIQSKGRAEEKNVKIKRPRPWWSSPCLVQISSKKKNCCDKGLLLYGLNLQQLEQFIKANIYTAALEFLQKYFHKNSHQSQCLILINQRS